MACKQISKVSTPFQTITPPTTPATINGELLKADACLLEMPTFLLLFTHAKLLIRTQGPYTVAAGTYVFTRVPCTQDSTTVASTVDLAISLAAAQDCILITQPQSPANEDMLMSKKPWEAAVATLEELLQSGKLDAEVIGWGIFGLSSGYMARSATSSIVDNVQSYKMRLRKAFDLITSLDSTGQQWIRYRGRMRKVRVLATARSGIHSCTTMLLQCFRQDQWRSIRWWHVIVIAERWASILDLDHDTHLV